MYGHWDCCSAQPPSPSQLQFCNKTKITIRITDKDILVFPRNLNWVRLDKGGPPCHDKLQSPLTCTVIAYYVDCRSKIKKTNSNLL